VTRKGTRLDEHLERRLVDVDRVLAEARVADLILLAERAADEQLHLLQELITLLRLHERRLVRLRAYTRVSTGGAGRGAARACVQ
jgi:hypothetical protein